MMEKQETCRVTTLLELCVASNDTVDVCCARLWAAAMSHGWECLFNAHSRTNERSSILMKKL
jgi:hypothetical protein